MTVYVEDATWSDLRDELAPKVDFPKKILMLSHNTTTIS